MTGQNENKVAVDLSNNKIDVCLNFRHCSEEEIFAKKDKYFLPAATKKLHLDFNFYLSTVPSKSFSFNLRVKIMQVATICIAKRASSQCFCDVRIVIKLLSIDISC